MNLYNEDLEKALLGGFLLDFSQIDTIGPMIDESVFYIARHQWIYEAMLDLHKRNINGDSLTVADELERKGQLEEVGGAPFVMDLINCPQSTFYLEHYAKMLVELAQKREMARFASQTAQLAHSNEPDAMGRLAEMMRETSRRYAYNIGTSVPLDELATETIDLAIKNAEDRRNGRVVEIKTPFWHLNDAIHGGFLSGDLVGIVGIPGMGKSMMAHQIADKAARDGHGVLMFTTEMNRHQFFARHLAPVADIQSRALRAGVLNEMQWERIYNRIDDIRYRNMFVNDAVFDITHLEAEVQKVKMRLQDRGFDLRLLVFDYLQLFKDTRRKDKRTEVGDAINTIRELTNRYQTVSIVVSSLAREGYKNGAIPSIFNSKESGDIEYALSVGLALYQDENKQIICDIQKMRDGQPGKIVMPQRMSNHAWFETHERR